MSKAVVFDAYGEPDVLHVTEGPPPIPGPGQVRVHVHAAGVQPFDALFRSGAAHQWVPARFPQRLGNEFAGVVDALGDGATGWRTGAEVLGWAMLSSYAEHVVVGVDDIVGKPATMSWRDAGVLSASGQTAATALAALGVGQGDTLLIHAAGGGVGTFAVQIAAARGATVVGTASPSNHDYLRALGAFPVAYGDGLAERVRSAAPTGVDAALDASGTVEALHTSLELVGDPTRIGTVAFQPAADQLGVRRLSTDRSAAQLTALTALHTAGQLRVSIHQAYPLAEAADAHRTIETGHVRGKVVLFG
ncbi:MAG: NADP-dependent oxidoreductase [Haloechinothrix sp.]